MLLLENSPPERFRIVAGQNRYGDLDEDRPVVDVLIHEVNGCAGDASAELERLSLCVHPFESGE